LCNTHLSALTFLQQRHQVAFHVDRAYSADTMQPLNSKEVWTIEQPYILKQLRAPVISNIEIMPRVHLLRIRAPEIAKVSCPGQFVMVRCGEGYDLLLRRPISIHDVDGEHIDVLFKIVGRGTEWLSQVQVKDQLDVLGPLGNGFSVDESSRNILLVAGGIGVAPLKMLAKQIINSEKSVTLLIGAETATLVYPNKLLPSGLNFVVITEDGSTGRLGRVTDLIPEFAKQADQIFAAGPLPMYSTMASQRCLKNKLVQVTLEMRMGCGMGACYACTIKTKNGLKQVCKNGPVFEMNDLHL